jgi:hypothetical protein
MKRRNVILDAGTLAALLNHKEMSFADACLVRMSELFPDSAVFTIDGDFKIYRRHGRQPIPLIFPEK